MPGGEAESIACEEPLLPPPRAGCRIEATPPPGVVVPTGAATGPIAPLPTMRAELARYCWMRSSSQLPCRSSMFLSDSTSSRRDLAVRVSSWCSAPMARSVASSSATATLLLARHRLAASRLRARGSGCGCACPCCCCAGNVVGCEEGPGWERPGAKLLVVAVVAVDDFFWCLELLLSLLLLLFFWSSLVAATALMAGAIGTCAAAVNPGAELFR